MRKKIVSNDGEVKENKKGTNAGWVEIGYSFQIKKQIETNAAWEGVMGLERGNAKLSNVTWQGTCTFHIIVLW